MENTKIFRDDGIQFIVGERLGSGLLGVVYAATAENGEQVAVKVPAPNLSLDQRNRFQQEYDLLQTLGGEKLTPNVPKAWWGRDAGGRSKILLLEMVKNPLHQQLREMDGLEKERLAWEAGGQYAMLLRDLHNAGFTCSDRKLGDFYWDAMARRLIVLDWNAVRRKRDDGVIEDIQIFGGLWYQMLTQRYRPNSLDPLDNAQWNEGSVTYGSRYLLKLLLDQTNAVSDDHNLLVDDITNWYETLQGNHSWRRDGLRALEKAQEADEAIKRQLDRGRDQRSSLTEVPPFDLKAEEGALVLLDLAQRDGDEQAEAGFATSFDMVQRRGERYTHAAELAFRISDLTGGNKALEAAEKSIDNAAKHPDLLLAIRRWQLLFYIANQAIRVPQIDLRAQREPLADAVRDLTNGSNLSSVRYQLGLMADGWQRIPNGGTAANSLRWYLTEIELHRLLSQADKAEVQDADYAEAVQYVQEGVRLLTVSETDGPSVTKYVVAIPRATAFAGLRREPILQRKADNAQLRADLKHTFSNPVSYSYLVQRHEELQRYFVDEGGIPEDIEQILDARRLSQIGMAEYHHCRGDYGEMLTALQPLLKEGNGDKNLQKFAFPLITDVVKQAERLIETGRFDSAEILLTQLDNTQRGQTLW